MALKVNLGKRKCQCGCKQPATQTNGVTAWASYECAMKIAQQRQNKAAQNNARRERKERREQKERLKKRSEWLQEAQRAFNSYIRERDKGKPCISSGVAWEPTFQAGHFLATSIRPELRFHEENVHGQSVRDNLHLHGNLLGYRKGLIERIGVERVEWLEGPHEPAKYSIETLKKIKEKYSGLTRELRKGKP